MTNTQAQVETLRSTVEEKLNSTVAEFANGKLSRELFQMIYSRYSGQLSIIDKALMTGKLDMVKIDNGEATVAIRDAYEGKARGIMIYFNRNGMVLETLGEVDVPLSTLAPLLNRFSMLMEEGKFIENQIKHISERKWLLLVAGKHTTIVVQFRNEPAKTQVSVIERLHHHFEKANDGIFTRDLFDASSLAYPFTVFVDKKRA